MLLNRDVSLNTAIAIKPTQTTNAMNNQRHVKATDMTSAKIRANSGDRIVLYIIVNYINRNIVLCHKITERDQNSKNLTFERQQQISTNGEDYVTVTTWT